LYYRGEGRGGGYYYHFNALGSIDPKGYKLRVKTKLEWLLVWTVDTEGIVQEHRIEMLLLQARSVT